MRNTWISRVFKKSADNKKRGDWPEDSEASLGSVGFVVAFMLASVLVMGGIKDDPQKNNENWIALKKAAQHGDTAEIQRLIDLGTPLDIKGAGKGVFARLFSPRDTAPLHWATIEEHKEVVRMLIAAGADVDARDSYYWTAAMSAARKCNTEIFQILSDAGADLDLTNTHGDTAMDILGECPPQGNTTSPRP